MAKVRARVTPLSKVQRLKESKLKRMGVHIAPGVHASTEVETWYRTQLDKYVDGLRDAIEAALFKKLRQDNELLQNADGWKWFKAQDGFMEDLVQEINSLRDRWEVSSAVSKGLAEQFIGKIDTATKKRIENVVGDAMGVDVAKLLGNEGLTGIIEAGIAANVQLISSIPSEYLDKVQMIITQEGIKGRSGESLIKQIQGVYAVTKDRARFIARDQTSKLNGSITRQRQTAVGIRGYRWRTVGDNAVRESHKERNGKFYAWNPEDVGEKLEDGSVMLDPQVDDIGNPGDDYQCRCIAEAVLELDRLL